MSADTRIFVARRIVTLNRSIPRATHLAVRDGRVLALGGAEIRHRFPGIVDDRFAGEVLIPGFVEGHGHTSAGLMWREPYVGFFPRIGPDGARHEGLTSIAAVVAKLRALDAALPAEAPLVVWGFDPIYFGGPRMTLADLDGVSTTRPVLVAHISGHIHNVNSVVMARAGFSRDSNLDGLLRDAKGDLAGEVQGPAVMTRAARATGHAGLQRILDVPALWDYAAIARRVGVTTSTDLVNALDDPNVAALKAATADPAYPIRLVPAMRARDYSVPDGVARITALRGQSSDKLHFGMVKLVADGSIQGFTARLRWPGYHNGRPNGLWYIAPAEFERIVTEYHRAGAQLHIHTNGDEASDLATEMVSRAVASHPRPDHRHTLQHCQMADEAIFRRMAAAGMCVNLFANHIHYWGDQHDAVTMGPSRAARLDACATALACGVPLAIHSDTPVTPLDPLFTMSCAVNRLTASGRVLGADERITPYQALHAVTLGAAYTLKLDHLVGSLDVGKFADCAVLADDPLEVDPLSIKDIAVRATILGGHVFPAS